MSLTRLTVVFAAAVLGVNYAFENSKETLNAEVVALDDTTPIFSAVFQEAAIKLRTEDGKTFYAYNKPTIFSDRKMKPSEVAKKLEVGKSYQFDLDGWRQYGLNSNITAVRPL